MIITLKKVAPVGAGNYKTVINDVTEYNYNNKHCLIYKLGVFADNGMIEFECRFHVNDYANSPFFKFKEELVKIYGDPVDTSKHIGETVLATFAVNTDAAGNEYTNLVSYKPYPDDIPEEPECNE